MAYSTHTWTEWYFNKWSSQFVSVPGKKLRCLACGGPRRLLAQLQLQPTSQSSAGRAFARTWAIDLEDASWNSWFLAKQESVNNSPFLSWLLLSRTNPKTSHAQITCLVHGHWYSQYFCTILPCNVRYPPTLLQSSSMKALEETSRPSANNLSVAWQLHATPVVVERIILKRMQPMTSRLVDTWVTIQQAISKQNIYSSACESARNCKKVTCCHNFRELAFYSAAPRPSLSKPARVGRSERQEGTKAFMNISSTNNQKSRLSAFPSHHFPPSWLWSKV